MNLSTIIKIFIVDIIHYMFQDNHEGQKVMYICTTVFKMFGLRTFLNF